MKKKLKDLTEKDKRRLKIPTISKFCNCSNPEPRNYITDMFEPYILCDECNKEII